ncbi:malate:quinone oxidoreductase, partial [Paenibacillus xylanexedens]|uniref:malate:quinone oxidoreductase n=1 Tax=Paenibacillus xylanexedens TaxID=528191 RepID=UPI0016426054
GSIAGLVGGWRGASSGVDVMLEIVEKWLGEDIRDWEGKIKEMIGCYGVWLVEKIDVVEEMD